VFEHFSNKRKIEALQEDFATLRREFNSLKLDWENTQNKLLHVMGRMNKRAALAQEKEDALMGVTATDVTPTTLTPRQRLINEQIARRRGNGQTGSE
jgi:hypothetical protein